MAFWVGGKYPSLVGSVSNFMGSDEFFVGPGEFPVEYRHTDNFANYLDRHVRLHMGTQDFIRGYHARMNRAWDFVLEHYEHVTYESKHRSAGLSDMLAFHLKAFQDPLARAKTFDHSDVYPEFEVWGWRVETDRHRPGFTLLGNVHAKGFRSVVRQWLPDGPLMNWVRVKVSTGAIYEPGQQYVVTDLDLKQERLVSRRVRSALDGRITWVTDGSLHEVGIVRASASEPVLVLGEHWIQRPGWLESGKSADLFFEIANKGVAPARGVRVQVRPRHRTGICLVKNGDVEIGWIGSGSRTQNKHAIQIEVPGNETDRIALDVEIADAEGRRWIQTLTLEVQRSTGQPPAFEVADGKVFDVLEHGNESNPRFLGRGNGDGIANPGETIVILLRDGDALRMTEARANDPFINPFDQARRFSDYWGKFDHVGSSAKVSELLLSADTPEHYQVPLHLYLLVPDYPEHLTRAERVSLDVRGEDTTPPELVFVEQTPGGVLRAKLRDGARIESVEAAIEGPAFANEHYALELRDDGLGVDAVADDFLFSAYWKPARRDSYPLHLRAEDVKGNVAVFETAVQSVNW